MPVDRNVSFEVMYRGQSVGRYVADLVVDQKVIVETKAAKAIDPIHRAQLANYLRASGLEVGLVANLETRCSSSVSCGPDDQASISSRASPVTTARPNAD